MTTKGRQGLPRFITTEAISPHHQASYQRVWDAIRPAFSSRESSIGYWRYPLFLQVGDRRKEPDILIVDQQWGIIVIEVCPAKIEQITSVNHNQIQFSDNVFQTNYSLDNISKYIQVLRQYCDQEPIKNPESDIQQKIIGRTLIAFPNISTEEWQQKGLSGTEEGLPFIFNNQLGEVGLRNRIEKAQITVTGQSLNDSQYKSLLSVISGTSILRKSLEKIESADNQSRYNILAEAQKLMYEWDIKQEYIGKTIPPGPQRVRGIAGSGKTVLFSQKAVIMHLKHPEWKIAFVFFTRSLYDQIEKLFEAWIEHFTNGEIKYQNLPNSNLRVLHAWGAKDRDGLYGEICKLTGTRKLNPGNTGEKIPNRGLAYGCRDLLKRKPNFKPIFDALVIDEGQDLMTEDDLKFTAENGEDKQPIYWLAYQSLKSVSEDQPQQKRLIWAYDEAQTIHSTGAVAPKAKQVFGKELSSILGGIGGTIYPGGIRKAHDMERCYRTPGAILTAAFALGTGLLRKQGILKPERMRKEDLQSIGFEVLEGKFSSNAPITITRLPENSPNPVPSISDHPVLNFETYNSRQDEFLALLEKIKHNLQNDQLQPSKNILIIALGYTTPPYYDGNNLEESVSKFLINYGIDIYIPSALRLNDINPQWPQNNRDLFWFDGGITISRIDRTKGNEADMVYLVGLDNIAKNESDTKLRNQLFVALTRSRGWVEISGIGDYPFYEEVKEVIAQGNTFTFTLKGVTPSEDANDDFTEENEQNL
ncbi:ATP-binding domain-containing protein [Cronbergia sp. UHCC 0137]|uniref:DEAD/DEAH box helicase n=1 Tax=Cronbergia sp. UHCC 0137 TaxID=3110239 RepID=UPI002B2213C9|nr:ATP-binding domain-containing protein [Cronbergia sp. UHCC 0137]MEA5616463.1 ATP-binding domain-containing protein [Cronbergia sp. UHCC 0137]